jgi:hypothetical protein
MLSDCFHEGYDAFHNGDTFCPYDPGTEEANHWQGGYETAQEEQAFDDSWL